MGRGGTVRGRGSEGEWEGRGGKGNGRDEPPLSKSWIRRCKLWLIIGQIFASDRGVPHFNVLARGDALLISL